VQFFALHGTRNVLISKIAQLVVGFFLCQQVSTADAVDSLPFYLWTEVVNSALNMQPKEVHGTRWPLNQYAFARKFHCDLEL